MNQQPRIIESVPNFSEGRNPEVINQIADAIRSVEGVTLLNIDPGEAANRTVMTFIGQPELVVEAAFRAARAASQLIDMSQHHGTHPRIGATDVLPLVPISGVTLEECADLARALARRMADELLIPCYLYEAAALKPSHRNLAVCRAGEYEGLPAKLLDPEARPDVMPGESGEFRVESLEFASAIPAPTKTAEANFTNEVPTGEGLAEANSTLYTLNSTLKRSGASVVGARDFLIAVNFNLDTKSVPVAHDIACAIRERGRGGVPGTLKCVKAIGWYIDEYGIAQVSVNLTNMNVTPLHVLYEEVCRQAAERGVRVTGTEIIGLVPRCALLEAGRYFLGKAQLPTDLPEDDIMQRAVSAMHLDDLRPFDYRNKTIG